MEMTPKERMILDDILTDNVALDHCRQCKGCRFSKGNTNYSNSYDKSSCAVFEYPLYKPLEVINNRGECRFRRE